MSETLPSSRKIEYSAILDNQQFKATYKKLTGQAHNKDLSGMFIKSILPHIPEFYKGFLSEDDLSRFIANRLAYLEKRSITKPVAQIAATEEEDFWLAQTVVLECITNESPFIIDSLIEYLQSEGIKIRALINPVIRLNREKAGLTQIYEADASIKLGQVENFCIFLLDKKTVKKDRPILKSVLEVLDTIAKVVQDYPAIIKNAAALDKEPALFEWLKQDNFIFLGFKNAKNELGLFKHSKGNILPQKAEKASGDKIQFFVSEHQSSVNKARKVTIIKAGSLGYIAGMFTRKAESTSAARIPYLAEQLERKFKSDQSLQTLFGKKDFYYAFNLLPLSFSFALKLGELIEICEQISNARIRADKLVRILRLEANRSILFLALPLQEFSDKKNQRLRKQVEDSGLQISFEANETMGNSVFLFFELKNESSLSEGMIQNLENQFLEDLQSWDDTMNSLIEKELSEELIEFFQNELLQAVPESYKSAYIGKQALRDMREIYHVLEKDFSIKVNASDEEMYVLILARQKRTLTDFVPVLDDFGLEVLREESYEFNVQEERIHYFKFYVLYNKEVLKIKKDRDRLQEAISMVYEDRTSSETINELVLSASLNIHQVTLLKALISYLFQVRRERSRKLIKDTLKENTLIPVAIVGLFQNRFLSSLQKQHPSSCKGELFEAIFPEFENTESFAKAYSKKVEKQLQAVVPQTTAQLEIFENLQRIVGAIFRTNYFLFQDEISFKIAGKSLEFLREPKPYFEIWVYHRSFEGVHLRGGPVSRGGIRWSDRKDDFRTEVWGLFKTQVLKNTVIVPTGSKGGFILKQKESDRDFAVKCYQRVMRSFLTLTDNREQGEIVHTNMVPRLDADDPYLVVAADKGTAAFSDFANDVSESMGFWLGDAFASGGKNGYNHKDYGITARGAWESARWHFHMRGMAVDEDLFTVVAIGDMSGDVFGNGMLLSKKIRLVGAFNHMHIFIDPEPDAEVSFKERQRLFKNPKLRWTDYDKKLISKGGGVFERKALSIQLTAEMRAMFNIEEKNLNGDQLIKAMLKAPVDMLFNGGIGTYIKASQESDDEVGDMANDNVRVNAIDLSCSMIVEGGNLGITALGRSEFSLSGGIINTDALDNSGGVDMSDHEVNLKILCKSLLDNGKLATQAERNKLLRSLSKKEVNLVLATNFLQNRAINFIQSAEVSDQKYVLGAFERLEKEGLLNRDSEQLPGQAELEAIFKSHEQIPRPFLAILLAYEKLEAQSNFKPASGELANQFLFSYFPEELHKYSDEINNHPLSTEIQQLTMVNYVLDQGGIIYLEKARNLLNLDVQRAIELYLQVNIFLDVEQFREKAGLPLAAKRNLKKANEPAVDFAMFHLIEKSIFRFLEMTMLFPLSGPGNLPEPGQKMDSVSFSKNLQPAFPDWISSLKESFRKTVTDTWFHIEIRYIMQYVLKLKKSEYEKCAEFYFSTGMLALKRALYEQDPRSKWEVYLLISLKRRFWEGLVSAYLNQEDFFKQSIDLEKEITALDSEGMLDLSTLGGLIGYTFER